MKRTYTKWEKVLIAMCIFMIFGIGWFLGTLTVFFIENEQVGDYDLYQCIYNNAATNDFNQHPEMIKKIQDECVCFRQYDYNLTKTMDENLC